jgi:membrane-associated phospholipid phosphatase/MFS family permease
VSTLAYAVRGSALRLGRMPFLVVFAAAALGAGLGRSVTTTYLPYLLNRIDDAPALIGVVMLVNAAAGMLVPLVVGVWSDKLRSRGRSARMPFVIGGSLVTAGGLAAIALGHGTSYLVLALAGAAAYTGLNAVTTAHRALVPEIFDASKRPRATSAQELAMLVGGLAGVAVGGALTLVSPWAPFVFAAGLVPLLSWPTIRSTREPGAAAFETAERESFGIRYYATIARRPGVRGLLVAQILWVLGYAALPAFFLVYADKVLDLAPAVASIMLVGFGVATGAAVVGAGRVKTPARIRPLLLLGVTLMGAGFLGVAAAGGVATAAPALLAAAVGFGLVTTLGFPLFAELIPEGESGGYTALFFSVRSISSTIALPTAGWVIAASGSYRALFVLGGGAAILALVPLTASGTRAASVVRALRRRTALVVGLLATVPVLGLLVARTSAARLDERAYEAINGLGPGPSWLWELLDPHTRNYVVLIVLGIALAAVTRWRSIPAVFGRVMGSALLAWGLLEAVYAVYDRPRPEEVVANASLNGHSWAHLNSFPSGHMAITAALAVALALAFPRLRAVLWGYVAAVAFTRVMFGAHFPGDVIAGTALGTASALMVASAAQWAATRSALRRTSRRAASAQPTPIEMPSAAPASTSSPQWTPR